MLAFAIPLVVCSIPLASLARPSSNSTSELAPRVFLTEHAWSEEIIERFLSNIPTADESKWEPCIGQTREFASKRCTLLAVAGDPLLEAAVNAIEDLWNVDVQPLREGGLPIIRYLPGAPAVGVHGDRGATGLVPNATLVFYLTDAEDASGQTHFPDLGLEVTPQRGSALSFDNVDAATGSFVPTMRHGVRAVSYRARRDRLVVQVPLVLEPGQARAAAWPEHVSGTKHAIHMGFMAAILVVTAGYYIWDNYVSHWREHYIPVPYDTAIDGRM